MQISASKLPNNNPYIIHTSYIGKQISYFTITLQPEKRRREAGNTSREHECSIGAGSYYYEIIGNYHFKPVGCDYSTSKQRIHPFSTKLQKDQLKLNITFP